MPFTIGHGTTALRFDPDIVEILTEHCGLCHGGVDSEPAGKLDFDFTTYLTDPDGATGAYPARGRIYRRAVLQQNMPPLSAPLFFEGFPRMPDDARARLAEWLLAGAPE